MFAKGVLALGAGRNAIRLCPPLVLSKEQADCAVDVLDQSIGEIAKERGLA
jgi:4-aminobutyrate aminotransferase